MEPIKAKRLGLDILKCPQCGSGIPISAAIATEIEERARDQIRVHQAEHDQALARAERELAERRAALDDELQKKLEGVLAERMKDAEENARTAVFLQLEDLRKQIIEKDEQLRSAQNSELTIRTEKRALEERVRAVELEVSRRVDVERKQIEQTVAQRLQEEYRLRIADKEKALQDARKANDELNRKLQQGSQQSQGEVLELELESILRNAFPTDQLDSVPKGLNGADVVHKVLSRSGILCGTIVWEAKRTRAWNDDWVQKLKDDQRALKAELAVIVSEALPKDCRHFMRVRGVWVTSPQCASNLAVALRHQLAEVALARMAAVGKVEKLEDLYTYLTGSEFKHRVEAIVEAFSEMQTDLQEERRTAERRWAKREKQLRRVIGSTAGMYGDLQGVIGSSLESIPALDTTSHGESAPRCGEPIHPELLSSAAPLQPIFPQQ